MGLIKNLRGAKTGLFGITSDRVKREYAYIEQELQWWAELPRHSGLELSGTMLQWFWARMEYGKGDVVAHNHHRLLKDAIVRVLQETASTCREHSLPPDAYIDEASWLLTGFIDSVYRDMVYLEAEACRVQQERESQARRFTSPVQKPEEPRPVHEIARCLKQGARQFDIEDGTRRLTHFLTEQGKAFKLLTEGQQKPNGPGQGGGKKRKITLAEADIEVRRLLKEIPSWEWTVRKLAEKIGCSVGLISQCPAWKAYKERRDRVRKEGTIKTVSLTSEMETVLGTGEKDDVLLQLIADQQEDERADAKQARLYVSHERKPKRRES